MGGVFGIANVYAAVDYHHNSGSIYDIRTALETDTSLPGSSDLTTDDVIGELGKGFPMAPTFVVTLVADLGYHAWRRALSSDENEHYSHVLTGAEVRADYAFAPRLVGTLRLGLRARSVRRSTSISTAIIRNRWAALRSCSPGPSWITR